MVSHSAIHNMVDCDLRSDGVGLVFLTVDDENLSSFLLTLMHELPRGSGSLIHNCSLLFSIILAKCIRGSPWLLCYLN